MLPKNRGLLRFARNDIRLVVCHEVDQSLFTSAVIAEAENECGRDAEDQREAEQDSEQLQVAELCQGGKGLRYITGQ